ncbi:MAG: sulfur carrier protein ThiS [Desulfobacterales bacterium]|nr:sulfur carrier protein ThiS [Desulfobacterales bacterium]
MNIIVNGKQKEIAPATILISLVRELELDPEAIVAEHNGRIVRRDEYDSLALAENDILELIRFVGGG